MLGGLALLHFMYRWALLLATGNAFSPGEPLGLSVASVALHMALPAVSLLLPLPAKRNFAAPMIWPEFRLHSLLFSSRHALACIAALAFGTTVAPASSTSFMAALSSVGCGMALNHATLLLATGATFLVGDLEWRTTNAMPYPAGVTATEVAHTRRMYRGSQFFAGGLVHAGDATLSFLPLLAIQIAPFMMTLVRKGRASPAASHCVYAWALWLNLVGLGAVLVHHPEKEHLILRGILIYVAVTFARIDRGWPKHVAWTLAPLFALVVASGCSHVASRLPGFLPPCPRRYYLLAMLAKVALSFLLGSYSVFFPPLSQLTRALPATASTASPDQRSDDQRSDDAHRRASEKQALQQPSDGRLKGAMAAARRGLQIVCDGILCIGIIFSGLSALSGLIWAPH
ncbi:hypothetical protein T484DRAFT_1834098 [Baffinella frigidus]|nr:hypothetical protein T484DRAFT_1834098 [Cryptophyta sp. CCMP2293]